MFSMDLVIYDLTPFNAIWKNSVLVIMIYMMREREELRGKGRVKSLTGTDFRSRFSLSTDSITNSEGDTFKRNA